MHTPNEADAALAVYKISALGQLWETCPKPWVMTRAVATRGMRMISPAQAAVLDVVCMLLVDA